MAGRSSGHGDRDTPALRMSLADERRLSHTAASLASRFCGRDCPLPGFPFPIPVTSRERTMSNEPQERVEPCFRCGKPAEQPAIGQGHVAGQEEERPLCVPCLDLLLTDPRASWAGMRRRKESPRRERPTSLSWTTVPFV